VSKLTIKRVKTLKNERLLQPIRGSEKRHELHYRGPGIAPAKTNLAHFRVTEQVQCLQAYNQCSSRNLEEQKISSGEWSHNVKVGEAIVYDVPVAPWLPPRACIDVVVFLI